MRAAKYVAVIVLVAFAFFLVSELTRIRPDYFGPCLLVSELDCSEPVFSLQSAENGSVLSLTFVLKNQMPALIELNLTARREGETDYSACIVEDGSIDGIHMVEPNASVTVRCEFTDGGVVLAGSKQKVELLGSYREVGSQYARAISGEVTGRVKP